jgi:hypothetical protein
MIFTCNFANWEKIPVPVLPISIARFPPKGFKCQSYEPLFPPLDLFEAYKKNAVCDSVFTDMYTGLVLAKLNPATVVDDLYNMAEAQDMHAVVLLCYEASNRFCHRHLARKWLEKNGITAMEFEIKPTLKTSLGLRKKHD